MSGLEAACLAIVALYVGLRLRGESEARAVLARLVALAVAGFLGEASCVRGYGLYTYAGGPWTLWLDVVPLVVVLTWPIVIHSAWELARALSPQRAALLGAALVLADASLIEPVAVSAGLWSWTAPGPFAVPPIGVLGWALFAFVAMLAFERAPLRAAPLVAALVPPLLVHPLLLALWWGGLRYLPPLPALPTFVGVLALAITSAALLLRLRPRVAPALIWLRAPGAAFFFALLALKVRDPLLVAWTLSFALPYAGLLWVSRRGLAPKAGNPL